MNPFESDGAKLLRCKTVEPADVIDDEGRQLFRWDLAEHELLPRTPNTFNDKMAMVTA
jgi:hypothetical protein